jgi:hypothetical protein
MVSGHYHFDKLRKKEDQAITRQKISFVVDFNKPPSINPSEEKSQSHYSFSVGTVPCMAPCPCCTYLRFSSLIPSIPSSLPSLMLTFAPVVSPWLAAVSCVLITMLLVGSLFFFPLPQDAPDSTKQRLDRDHPLVIYRRFKGILLTSVLVPIYLWFLLNWSGALSSTLVNATNI